MILNVSGRTDICAFYSDWFMNRYKEGYVMVRNPFNEQLVSKIYFEDVDGIIFCTKNPIPMIDKLKYIDKPYLFHVTLTPYKKDIEPGVPPKGKIIEAIKKLSSIVGIDNLYIRYDPVFISDTYTIDYHIKEFDKLCELLDGYVKHIIISFLDMYKNVKNNMKDIKYKPFTEEDYKNIGINFSKSAKEHAMSVQTCFEKRNLVEYGFVKGDCLNIQSAYKLTGKDDYKLWKARKGNYCACVEMVDIGVYNSCIHLCKYCYANYNEKIVNKNIKKHDKNSPFLIGNSKDNDIIKIRRK